MSARYPSSGASRHLLPQGEKELLSSPSPLEGEGGSRRLTDEGAAGRTQRFAKQLRKDMTDAEKKLWYALRDRRFENFKFRRQVPIGKYIADFVCQDCKLIVEVDGSQHEGSEHDRERDAWLTSVGYRVMRFWNIDTFKALDGTLLAILDALNETPHPSRAARATPSPSRGEGRSNRS
ncbi:MAG: endonuclease domain-containing protein [Hyphomicrobiales bacterium]|nr:endonuclease domain-containing protein [Hyphomicrobiales bacterium]